MQDCTNDEGLCAANEECDRNGNCVPRNGVCVEKGCSPENPKGGCDEGFTCLEGSCQEVDTPSEYCQFSEPGDTMAVRMIKRGASLAEEYLQATETIANMNNNDPEYNTANIRYYRSRFYLRNYMDLIETLRATYDIFGKVY